MLIPAAITTLPIYEEKALAVGIIVGLTVLITWLIKPSKESATQPYFALPLSALGDITCTFPRVLHANYSDNKIKHELPDPETTPIVFTFSDIKEESPKLKYIDATRTISEVALAKILDDEGKIVFAEGTGDPYLTIHTIHKKVGVATYTKQYSLLGTPVGTLAMGSCVDS